MPGNLQRGSADCGTPDDSRCAIPSWRWVELFARQFELCGAVRDEPALVLCDSDTDRDLLESVRLALQRCDTTPVVLEVNPRVEGSDHLAEPMALAAAKVAELVIDCTEPGIAASAHIDEVAAAGARVLGIGNRSPRNLERFTTHPGLKRRVLEAARLVGESGHLWLTSADGTDLSVDLADADVVADWGGVEAPADLAHWPGGSIMISPAGGSTKGRLVVTSTDVNLTFREYARSQAVLEIENDHIAEISGQGSDAELLRRHFSEFPDTSALGVGSIGWGMHQTSRRGKPVLHDPDLIASGEASILAGLCLVTFGSNAVAGRTTGGLLELSLQGMTVALDDVMIVNAGRLVGDLAPDVYEMAASS